MQFEVHPDCCPKFSLGQKVWFIKDNEKKYGSGKVDNIRFILFQDSKGPMLMCVGYTLDLDSPKWIKRRGHRFLIRQIKVSDDDVYESEDVVKKLTTWHSVTGISDPEWLKAIGDENREDCDQSELSPCCGNISQVRDMLMYCKKKGGLTERQAEFVKSLLKSSHPDFLKEQLHSQSILGKIFRMLGITDEGLEDESEEDE